MVLNWKDGLKALIAEGIEAIVFRTVGDQCSLWESLGAVGTSADNALAESFNAALKREVLQDNNCWEDAETCRREVFRWLVRYNTKRRHSHCRYVRPINYERNQTPATLREAA